MIKTIINNKIEQEIVKGKEYLDKIDKRDYLIDLSAKLSSIKLKVSGDLFGISDETMSTCLTQFIIQRYLFTTLNISVLRSLGRKSKKIVCTLPPSHLRCLVNEESFNSNHINFFKWFGSILYWYTAGLYTILRVIFLLLKNNVLFAF